MVRHWWLARVMGGSMVVALVMVGPAALAQPVDPLPEGSPPQPVAPPAAPIATPPDAAEVTHRLEAALAPRPGGLRTAEVAQRAEMSSPEVRAKQQAVAAAAARVDQAALMFIPQFTLTARYVRLSPLDSPSLGEGGSLVGANVAPGEVVPVICPDPSSPNCFAEAVGVEVSFPVILNNYLLQGSLGVPLSDYVLRLSQNHAAASKNKRAAELQERAARVKSQLDAKVAFYNWIRAKGGRLLAEQGLETAHAHLKDVKVAEQVGSASRADLLAVEGQVASTELLVESSKNMEALSEEQIRVMMHDPASKRYEIGEDIMSPVRAAPITPLRDLYAEALRQRLERRVIEESVSALRESRKVLSAGYYPRLDGFANLYHQNPSQRVFPQEEKFTTTWDVGLQLTWTVNDTFTSGAQVEELDAKIMEIEAQRAQLDDGIRLQVTQTYNALREAEVAKGTTERQLKAAEESYRVRRELFRAGRATSSELTDAETALLKARFDALNARIDTRVARENFEHALGRDVAR